MFRLNPQNMFETCSLWLLTWLCVRRHKWCGHLPFYRIDTNTLNFPLKNVPPAFFAAGARLPLQNARGGRPLVNHSPSDPDRWPCSEQPQTVTLWPAAVQTLPEQRPPSPGSRWEGGDAWATPPSHYAEDSVHVVQRHHEAAQADKGKAGWGDSPMKNISTYSLLWCHWNQPARTLTISHSMFFWSYLEPSCVFVTVQDYHPLCRSCGECGARRRCTLTSCSISLVLLRWPVGCCATHTSRSCDLA